MNDSPGPSAPADASTSALTSRAFAPRHGLPRTEAAPIASSRAARAASKSPISCSASPRIGRRSRRPGSPLGIRAIARRSSAPAADMSPRANARPPAAARCCAPSRPTESAVVVDRAELPSQVKRLLEVVPENLLVLARDLPYRGLEPPCDGLVQHRSRALRHGVVHRVPDQRAVETKRISDRQGRAARLDQLRADERAKGLADRVPLVAPERAPRGRRARTPCP